MEPLISVIVPAYNARSFLMAAVRSVSDCAGPSRELIIIDDGSTDGTERIAREIEAKEPWVRVGRYAPSGKPAVARNRGIREAKGEFLCFLDADDLYHREKLERQLALFRRHPEVQFCFSDTYLMSQYGEVTPITYLHQGGYLDGAWQYLHPVGDKEYLCRSGFYGYASGYNVPAHTGSVMVRRDALEREENWFPEDLTIGEDIDLWYRLLKGVRSAFIDVPLCYYRQHDASITRKPERYMRGAIAAHSRNYDRALGHMTAEQRRNYRRRIGGLYFHLGYHLQTEGRLREARACYLQSVWRRPALEGLSAALKTLVPARVIASAREWRHGRG